VVARKSTGAPDSRIVSKMKVLLMIYCLFQDREVISSENSEVVTKM